MLASALQSFANSSLTIYAYAIGEFEALSLPTYSRPISPVHSPMISSKSFLFYQDDFPCLYADVGFLSNLPLPTWSASSIPPVFTASSFPPLCLSSNISSAVTSTLAVVTISSAASASSSAAVSSSVASVAAVSSSVASAVTSSVASAADVSSSVASAAAVPLLLLLLLMCPLLLLLLCPLLLLLMCPLRLHLM